MRNRNDFTKEVQKKEHLIQIFARLTRCSFIICIVARTFRCKKWQKLSLLQIITNFLLSWILISPAYVTRPRKEIA